MSNYGSFSKIGRKNHNVDILKSKIGRKNHYLEKFNSKNWRKIHYSQKLCFDKFFEWKEYNFLSGFRTNIILNFCQECSWLTLKKYLVMAKIIFIVKQKKKKVGKIPEYFKWLLFDKKWTHFKVFNKVIHPNSQEL